MILEMVITISPIIPEIGFIAWTQEGIEFIMFKLQPCKLLSLIAVGMLLLGSGLVAAHAADNSFHVTLDTSGLSGTSGQLAFDVIDGDGVLGNNTATVSAFATSGTLVGASNNNTAGATGDLPGTLTLLDSGFTESNRGITFGNLLSFDLTFTNNFAGAAPDEFSFFLLDSAGTSSLVSTSDPLGADSLFIVDATGLTGNGSTVFTSNSAGVSWSVDPIGPTPVSAVPEGGALPMLLAGGIPGVMLIAKRRLRRRA